MRRRFEILLPLRFNDGTPVPPKLVGQTKRDLRKQFGALSFESQQIFGVWLHEGQTYHDQSSRLFLDAPDSQENIWFFRTFKETLKKRFRQLDIWIVSFVVEVH
ncbi:MAG: hypothetical protein WD768_01975 [Phycisphaeraceae bacterium]